MDESTPATQDARQPRFRSGMLARASNIPLLGSTRGMSRLQNALGPLAEGESFPKLASFLAGNFWLWLRSYAYSVFHRRFRPYPTYEGPHTGVYQMRSAHDGGPIRISLTADWGTGTRAAWKVAQCMVKTEPDYTIHLGDVYFVGDVREVSENFLGKLLTPHDRYTPVAFPRGRVGTFALLGNHEMYGGGRPYFTRMLPYCDTGEGHPQQTSFFCLETDRWRILGLDTGYNSVGLPFLSSIPWVNRQPWVGADACLRPELLTWLRETIRPREHPKATLLLSHHQPFSAWGDEAFPRTGQQLREIFGEQSVVWLWGHEHRLALYHEAATPQGIRCHGRCVGNGGMPVETGEPRSGPPPLAYWDPRRHTIGGHPAGWNGFVTLALDAERLSLEYRDLNDVSLLRESFLAGQDGALEHHFDDVPVLQSPAAHSV